MRKTYSILGLVDYGRALERDDGTAANSQPAEHAVEALDTGPPPPTDYSIARQVVPVNPLDLFPPEGP